MRVHLVRHGCAGDKDEWPGPDADRPLDRAGLVQAAALVGILDGHGIGRLASSPARRCRDTLRPFSTHTGLPIETTDVLGPSASADDTMGIITDPTSRSTAFCTHGEVLEGLLAAIREQPVLIDSRRNDDEWLLLKGSAWELRIEGQNVISLRHFVPAPLTTCPTHAWTSS